MTIATLVAFIGLTQQPFLERVDIDIAIEGDTAVVNARFTVADAPGHVELVTIRFRGQSVTLVDPREGRVDTDAGSWRLALETRPEAEPTMSVTYRVLGNLERIPILSPRLPTDPVQSAVEIRVSGAPRGALADVFPRMTRLANGVLEARPANVPSFVRIPVVGARSFNRWGDLSVLTLLVVGSVWWAIRMRRRSTGVE